MTSDGAAGVAARLGYSKGSVVQEFGYDEDVDLDLREAVEAALGAELEDEDFDDVTDGALVWWREEDGDAHDLTDLLTDALVTLEDGGLIWLLTPKAGRPGHVRPGEVEEAVSTAGLHTTSTLAAGEDWSGYRLTARGRGK